MKELDLLKKDWKARENNYPKLNKEALYALILKRSSSIVKWLYYISIGEFIFWTLLNFISQDSEKDALLQNMHLLQFIKVLTIINYIVLLYFIYCFYRNYKKVSFTASSKELIDRILKVRKTVNRYVWFNLSILGVSLIAGFYGLIHYGPAAGKFNSVVAENDNPVIFWGTIILIVILIIGVVLIVLWGFYRLLYGILLRKLKANHKELLKLEA